MKRRFVFFLAVAAVVCGCLLSGCGGEEYYVDYGGGKEHYRGAKDSYRAGETVTLTYDVIATDTDYSFYLDGEPLDFSYEEGKGFVLSFLMPEHDVKLEVRTVNTMEMVMEGTEED